MAKLINAEVHNTDGQSILNEIIKWKAELDDSFFDAIIESTLETVIDIIYDNSECELNYENT